MDEKQITNAAVANPYLRDVFTGVYAADELGLVTRLPPIALIANFQKRSKPGSHWVAIYIDEDLAFDYFCSFGSPIPDFVLAFARRYQTAPVRVSQWSVQSPLAVSCAKWCLLFLSARSRKISMSCFYKNFGNYDWERNEKTLTKLYKSRKMKPCPSVNDD